MTGYLGMIQESRAGTAEEEEHFLKLRAAAKRISAMIRFTGEYEEIGIITPAWQEISTLIRRAAREAPVGDLTLTIDLPDTVEVFADPLIVKVFYNLMENAVRSGGTITTIEFSVVDQDGDLIMVCEDDGEGVRTEEKERIFGRGFGKNTGLGLFLAREILSITDITIRETGEPGKGARFEITIPPGRYRIRGEAGHNPEEAVDAGPCR